MPDETSAELLARYRNGDDDAAEELFCRYVTRLTSLARTRLSPKLATRTDPEDVVLSAYRSFFVGVRKGRFRLRRSGDPWRLLVSITTAALSPGPPPSCGPRTVTAEQPSTSSTSRPPTARDPPDKQSRRVNSSVWRHDPFPAASGAAIRTSRPEIAADTAAANGPLSSARCHRNAIGRNRTLAMTESRSESLILAFERWQWNRNPDIGDVDNCG
jgi:hypothetical protein